MKRRQLNARGFTLLELMIATVIFSTILLSTTVVLIQLGRMYYKGLIINRTQETTRSTADEISQQIQFGGQTVTVNDSGIYYGALGVKSFCIGTQRYSYVINAKVSVDALEDVAPTTENGHVLQHALWRDTISSGATCTPLNLSKKNPGGTDGQELLGQNMRLSSNFRAPDCSDDGICSLTVAVLYGDDDLLTPDAEDPTKCGNVIGSQWCAASTISTQIFKRLRVGS